MDPLQNRISVLPHEILGEIFTQSSAVYPDAPIVLGAVSRVFRHVTYTTPLVWSHLKLSDTDESRKTRLWFERSRACQVNVQVVMWPTAKSAHGVDATVEAPAAVEALRLYTARIASLSLRTDTHSQARAALGAIYSDVSPTNTTLRSLRISVAVAATLDPRAPFPAIHSVTELETTNVALGTLASLDLTRLRSLRVVQPLLSAPVAADDILELVRGAPSLQRLTVDARIADEATTAAKADPCVVVVPELTELHLRANNVVALLDRVMVPELRVLHLDDLDGKRANASAEIGATLHQLLVRIDRDEKSGDHLRVFELVGVEVERSDASWKQCLQRMKALEVFTVSSPGENIIAVVDASIEAPRKARPIKAGFAFGFGFGAPREVGTSA
ncbi:hypothetical protein B0H16DRAFT_1572998 [Mycena metata]|uniref:F-box domain-containing protein n=1 Tax=Mycena metata TaxID=1033252 RepID=A0AAD7I920_9AGAR|nr:hypothetical protein B0H16DRAFT_1572998 [Mycena metata]